jgi:molybdopterin biosynthesis enzyme
MFVRPFILRLQGVQRIAPRAYTMRADFDWPKADKPQRVPACALNDEGGLERCSQPEFRRADVHRVGRWRDRQSARPGHSTRRQRAIYTV